MGSHIHSTIVTGERQGGWAPAASFSLRGEGRAEYLYGDYGGVADLNFDVRSFARDPSHGTTVLLRFLLLFCGIRVVNEGPIACPQSFRRSVNVPSPPRKGRSLVYLHLPSNILVPYMFTPTHAATPWIRKRMEAWVPVCWKIQRVAGVTTHADTHLNRPTHLHSQTSISIGHVQNGKHKGIFHSKGQQQLQEQRYIH